ncbi:TetR family transcriptional regulator [Geodermatophilaceae bacterium NBWT11]|nr:TetR family transcriptional regulator [Geodermatophilaceae bacterium NBWT11]
MTPAYAACVQEGSDRRARKKALTRTEIRDAAHLLFAERGFDAVTIADVAERADVAVQTVFNHFAAKEDLFFADRTPWVDRPAQAVRERSDGVGPVAALRDFLQREINSYPASVSRPERRRYLEVLSESDALRAAESQRYRVAERTLARAVLEAWETDSPRLKLSADLVAGQFLSAARVLIVAQRRLILSEQADVTDADIAATTTAVFDAIAAGLQVLDDRAQAESTAAGSTTGSSTSATSSSTSASVSGTAKAV